MKAGFFAKTLSYQASWCRLLNGDWCEKATESTTHTIVSLKWPAANLSVWRQRVGRREEGQRRQLLTLMAQPAGPRQSGAAPHHRQRWTKWSEEGERSLYGFVEAFADINYFWSPLFNVIITHHCSNTRGIKKIIPAFIKLQHSNINLLARLSSGHDFYFL